MKFIIAAVLLIPQLLLAEPVQGLLGRWKSENVLYGNNVEFRLGFNFTANKTELNVDCTFIHGEHLQASTSSRACYDVNHIFIQETKEVVTNDGYHFCRATLAPATWTAYFDGAGKMVLFVPVPYQAQFTLVPDTSAPSVPLL